MPMVMEFAAGPLLMTLMPLDGKLLPMRISFELPAYAVPPNNDIVTFVCGIVAPAWVPIKVLPLPVVMPSPVRHPTATLLLPVVTNSNARRPTAVFWKPLCQGRERNATKRRVKAINTRVEAIVTCQRGVTDSDVSLADCVFPERIGTNGRVKTGGRVVPHRCSANSGEMARRWCS